MKQRIMLCVVVTGVMALAAAHLDRHEPSSQEPDGGIDWHEILGPSQAIWPDPLDQVVWRSELRPALAEARRTNRPLFVTFRCLPCDQCADFDKNVLEGSTNLTPLLGRFITVRLTDARQLDFSIFPAEGFQDLDLSWWGYFLSADARVYGVFGGRDHVSDITRISEAALVNTLRRVLDHHYDPRHAKWDIDGPAADLDRGMQPPSSLPGFESWSIRRPITDGHDCLHCHQVAEVLRQPALDRGTFNIASDLDIWPLPENVGLVVDRDDGLLVMEVTAGSPAEDAGLRAGDVLGAAGGRKLFGQADFRGVLHRMANPAGAIEVHWRRDRALHTGVLKLAKGWRDTVLDWRISVSQGNIGIGPGFAWPLNGPRRGIAEGKMAVKPWFGREDATIWPAYQAGLRPRHIIIAVDGESPDLVGRSFMTWFRLRHEPGDEVVLTVLEGDRTREIRYTLPGKRPIE